MSSVRYQGNFSFINKTAETISSTEHRNEVAWHVMHRYAPYKRRRRQSAESSTSKSAEDPARTSPSASQRAEEQLPSSPLGQHPPLHDKLIAFACQELIPSIASSPSKYSGLLTGWRNLSSDGLYDCHDKAYLSLIATIMATHEEYLLTVARQLYTEALDELKGHTKLSERLVSATLCLFSVQTVLGHSTTARNLLKLLQSMTQSMGGIGSVNCILGTDILTCDIFFALRFQTRPLFPAKTWARKIAEATDQRPEKTVDLSSLKDFPVPFDTIVSLHELFAVREAVAQPTSKLQTWLQFRRLECLSRLADHVVNLKLYPHHYAEPAVEVVLTNATLLLAVMMGGSPEPTQTAKSCSFRLRESLLELKPEDFALHFAALCSAVNLGALTERAVPVDVPWFQMQQSSMAYGGPAARIFDHEVLLRDVDRGSVLRTCDDLQGLYIFSDLTWRLACNLEQRSAEPQLGT